MFKKNMCLFLCAAVLFLLCGCASLLEDKYVSITPHKPTNDNADAGAVTLSASKYSQLCDALSQLVENHTEQGIIKFESYEGDLEEDLSRACIYVSNDTPLGAYTVNHINSTLNKIVSFYEADIAITYKKTASDVLQIKDVEQREDLEDTLLPSVSSFAAGLAIRTADRSINADEITDAVSGLYYSHPDLVLYLPRCTVTTYTEHSQERIVEITFEYPFSSSVLKERSAVLRQRSDEIIAGMGDYAGDAAIEYFCSLLSRSVEFDQDSAEADDYDRWVISYTAYGSLVIGKAAGEGYAMAVKLLCDAAGIECSVVRGRLNNISHAWNIVRLENDAYYHIDASKYTGGILFRNDEEMLEKQYWWDTSIYPHCNGTSINTAALNITESTPIAGADEEQAQNPINPSDSETVEPGAEPEISPVPDSGETESFP